MTADVELLPCPFCGGTEIYIGPMTPSSAWEYWTVGCNNDDCPLDADSVKVEMGTLEKAAAAWNTRATDANLAPLQAENERLRADAERYRWLRTKLMAANFHPEDPNGLDLGEGVALIFLLPSDSHVTPDLDWTIDQARGKGVA